MRAPGHPASLRLTAAASVVAGGAGVVGGAFAIADHLSFGLAFMLGALAIYTAGGIVVIARIVAFHPHRRLGFANVLTLFRFIVASLIGGLVCQLASVSPALTSPALWFFCAAATFAVAIDGLDGPLARSEGLTSPFGARFDMEVDALHILLLSIAVFILEKAGAWVLASGALRYLYGFAGHIWPALRVPLPPSFRRKAVAAIQGAVLAALLAPVFVPPVSTRLALLTLALLGYSFTVDVIWTMRTESRARGAGA